MNTTELLRLKSISKTFTVRNTKKHFQALKNINIDIGKGEWVGIVGESGCGKSTLARIIAFLEPQDSGDIFFMDKELKTLNGERKKSYYKEVQMVFQNPAGTFSKRMKIGTYLMEPFINYKTKSKIDALTTAKSLLNQVNLPEEYVHKYPHELSGGELQRIVIARVIGMKPSLILFDEATSALDVTTQREILNLLLLLKEEIDFAAIFISHDIALVREITSRMYVLYEGEIVEEFETYKLMEKERAPYTKMLIESIFHVEKSVNAS